jgi:hypothetical protein
MLRDLFIYAVTAAVASITTIAVSAHEPTTLDASRVAAEHSGVPIELPAEHLVYSSQMSPETLVFSEELFSD